MRAVILGIVAGLAGLCCMAGGPACAGTRVALIIGESSYAHAPKLVTPGHDAEAVAAALRQVGFDSVTLKEDLDADGLRAALRAFGVQARGADVALVYYAGHGIEMGGGNYLIPVDATLAADTDVGLETVSLDQVLAVVGQANGLKVVVLDACRSNPFGEQMHVSNGTRSLTRGLAKVEPQASGTLVAFATAAGDTADDGAGSDSPFSTAFVKAVTTSSDDVRLMFGRMRDDVSAATNGRQVPAVYESLGGTPFYLGRIGAQPSLGPPPAAPAPAADQSAFELAFWDSIKSSTNLADFQAYLGKYPNGQFVELARNRLSQFASAQAAPTPPTPQAPAGGASFYGTKLGMLVPGVRDAVASAETAAHSAEGKAAEARTTASQAEQVMAQADASAQSAANGVAGYASFDYQINGVGTGHWSGQAAPGEVRNGYGVVTIAARGVTEHGVMANGSSVGNWVIVTSSVRYEGQVASNGMPNGLGVETQLNGGGVYEGEWSNGLKEGLGVQWAAGHTTIGTEGQFSKNVPNGYVIMWNAMKKGWRTEGKVTPTPLTMNGQTVTMSIVDGYVGFFDANGDVTEQNLYDKGAVKQKLYP